MVLTYLFKLALVLFTGVVVPGQAQEVPDLNCHALRGSLALKIINRELHFQIPVYQLNMITNRIPASVPTMTNSLKGKKLIQIAYHEGKRHKIQIEDVFDLKNSVNTITIRSRQGHETICPLKCEVINDQI